ncbi:integral membrane protein [Coniochaeta sp. 2T2.1]|nr:integral membrane protein [Coniochaeta sp. 2T2.1]
MNSTQPLESTIPIENGKQIGAIVSSAFSIAIPTILVGLRFWARRILRRPLDASDLCIFAALVFTISLHINMYILVLHGGFGFHVLEIVQRFGKGTLVLFFKCILAFPILWNVTVCFSKLSVLLMYTTLIPVREMVISCRIIGLVIILWNTGSVLGALLMCRPFALNWDRSLPGTCGDNRFFYMWLGAINVVAEAIMLLLPLPFLYRLQIETYKKVVVIGLFSVGWMTCAVSIYRQATLPHLYFEDMTYTGVLAIILSGIEPAVALSLACVPFLRPLVTGTVPTVHSHSSRSGGFKELNNSDVQLQPLGSNTGLPSP